MSWLVIFAWLGAARAAEPVTGAGPPPETAGAEAAARALGAALKGRLTSVLQAEGPAAAARVCADEAAALTAQVASETGYAVGRTSLRPRSGSNAGPDWAAAWLRAVGEGPAARVGPHRERVDGPRGPTARVLLPLAIEGPCVLCHGPVDALPADVRALLAARYPGDQAVGYQPGDLRGVIWAEGPAGPAPARAP
jgi:hypothetical protein